MRIQPIEEPKSKGKSTSEIHHHINEITSDGYDGISCRSGVVLEVTGDLSESDLSNISEYIGVELVPL